MKASLFLSSALLAASLTGCSLGSTPPPEATSPYVDLPARTSTFAGLAYDPEAFFYLLATFPAPPDQAPPPALYEGVPYLYYSSIPEATVRILDPDGNETASTKSSPTGSWQVLGIPSGAKEYQAKADPPAGGAHPGAGYMGPGAPPPPVSVPAAIYYPTTTLRPIIPLDTLCQFQVATMVGDAGALSALAKLLSKTVAEIVSKNNVALMWAFAPSFDLDLFTSPINGISAQASRGTLYAINWAPPGMGPPGQSAMGYFAVQVKSSSTLSDLGYYAVLLPTGDTGGPVTVTFKDTITGGMGPFPRPLGVPPIVAQLRPGVSFGRVFAFPAGGPGGPDPTADTVAFPPTNSQCYPQGGP